VNEGEAFTILRVECIEPDPAKRGVARKAVLVLKGLLGKPEKE
jgi:hypothetical protein